MVLVIPLTVLQVQQQQQLKQHALEGASVSVTLNPLLNSPLNPELNVNKELPVTIQINNLSHQNISAIDISLTYPLDLLSYVSFQPASGSFTPITTEPGNGSFHFAAVNPGDIPIIDSPIAVGTLQFKAKAKGTAKVKFSAATITASGSTSALGVDATAEGTYTISDPTTVVIAPTNTPTPTPIPNLFDCERLIAGTYKGNYACYVTKTGGVQCPSGWTEFIVPSTFTGTTCENRQRCCVEGVPTPTPVVAVATCIKLIDVNSLARKYTQRDPSVTLQMVNNKARQYKQNPCP